MHSASILVTLMLLSGTPEEAPERARSLEAHCRELRGKTLRVRETESARVVEATVELDDPQQSDELVEHCHVIAETVTVSSDDPFDTSTIHSSIRLPKSWNRRLFMGGSGALGGDLEETETRVVSLRGTMLQQRFATVFNDTGHVGANRADASWALDVPPSPGVDNQKELNYAAHSTHLSLITAKAVVRHFYRRAPQFTYFQGCSNGGRQGLMAATLYPRDFDGILAGAPAQPLTTVISRMGITQQAYLPLFGTLTPAKMARVTDEVLAKCDGDDGVADGILTDPRRCNFDPHVDLPACLGDVDGGDCFTTAQREFVAFNYSDMTLGDTEAIAYGFEPSSERGDALTTRFLEGWPSWITGTPVLGGVGLQFILHSSFNQFMVFDDPSYDPIGYLLMTAPAQIHLDALALQKLDLPKPDLTRFKRRGGKLILYHGWTDPSLAPEQTIRYFDDIEDHTEGRRDAFARLFMIPGMAHCEFGPGAQIFDGIGAIQRWVEQERKPDAMLAVDLTGTLSRPLCKYPTEPVYLGGDPAKASSYDCR